MKNNIFIGVLSAACLALAPLRVRGRGQCGRLARCEKQPMTRLLAIAVAVLAGLTRCASPEEIRAADEAACSSDGFQPNTPDFAGCLQRKNLARQYTPP